MAGKKVNVRSTQYTRNELVEKVNVLRRKIDTIILDLIYNPTSNQTTLQKIADLKKEVIKLPDIVLENHLFGGTHVEAKTKKSKRT
jgi:hypothetical protein